MPPDSNPKPDGREAVKLEQEKLIGDPALVQMIREMHGKFMQFYELIASEQHAWLDDAGKMLAMDPLTAEFENDHSAREIALRLSPEFHLLIMSSFDAAFLEKIEKRLMQMLGPEQPRTKEVIEQLRKMVRKYVIERIKLLSQQLA